MSYLPIDHDDRRKYIRETARAINILRKRCPTDMPLGLAFRGMSGALVVPEVGYLTNLPIVGIRKSTEPSHGGQVESTEPLAYDKKAAIILVDDFIDTGHTLAEMSRVLWTHSERRWQTVGAVLYKADTCPDSRIPRLSEQSFLFPNEGFFLAHVSVDLCYDLDKLQLKTIKESSLRVPEFYHD